jgi:hypothetical protein
MERLFMQSRLQRISLALALLIGLALLPGPVLLSSTAQETQWSGGRYFAETGHNLKNPFLATWQASGGEAVFGLPISEERYVEGTGGILQSFERITLIYDPSLDTESQVTGEALPSSLIESIAPATARESVARCSLSGGACEYVAQTRHTIADPILSFWRQHGGVTLLGLPLSEPFQEDERGSVVQVFEHSVLEVSDDGQVQLLPMGTDVAAEAELLETLPFLAAPPTAGTTRLVSSFDGVRLRAGPNLDAEIRAVLDDAAEFISIDDGLSGWMAGYADGFSGWVATEFLIDVPPLPEISLEDWEVDVWQGAALGETNVRREPTTDSEIVEVLSYGAPVTVTAWVKGEEVYQGADLWAKIGEDEYAYARQIGRNAPVLAPPVPDDAPREGRWIHVHLTQQLLVAYDGREPVRVMETTTGMAGWETPPGLYQILVRVPNETMTSGAIGAEHYYKLEDVLFTQYFTDQGHAIHFAWWRTEETIGRPGSHGCLNVLLDDARFLWDWASIGTPIYIH